MPPSKLQVSFPVIKQAIAAGPEKNNLTTRGFVEAVYYFYPIISRILHIVAVTAILVCMVMFSGCRPSVRSGLIGSKEASDSLLTPTTPFFESGQVDKARRFVDSVFYSLPDPTVFDYLGHYGTNAYYYGYTGNQSMAIVYIDSAIDLIEPHLPDKALSISLANFLISRGEANFNRNNFSASYEDYFKASEQARRNVDSCTTMRIVYNIAMVLYRQQQYASSAKYFFQTLVYNRHCEPLAYMNNREQEVLDNIGLCYTRLKKYDSAMYYYRLAKQVVDNNPGLLAMDSANSQGRYRAASQVIAGNMAKVYLGLQQPDSAIALYKRSISYHADLHDMQLSMVQLADIYVGQNDFDALSHLLGQFRSSLDSFPAPDLLMDYNRLMYLHHRQKNHYREALQYYTDYIRQKDSVAEKQKQLNGVNISDEINHRAQELEIQLLQKNNELNKTYLWVMVTLACMSIIILSLIYASYRTSRRNVAKLTELNEAITRANQEKDKILRMVAHDLRNPIGSIASLSNLILEVNLGKEEIIDLVKKIQGVSMNSLDLIGELLPAHSRAENSLKKKRTDIGELLRRMAELMQFRASEKKQQIITGLPDHPVYLTLNDVKIERVISNLLANAIKFSPIGGNILLRMHTDRDFVVISVKDDGIGIDTDGLEHIFDEFTSLKRKGTAGEPSFGLGLSISKQIVEEEGGSIWAESSKGSGSTFFIRLPGYR